MLSRLHAPFKSVSKTFYSCSIPQKLQKNRENFNFTEIKSILTEYSFDYLLITTYFITIRLYLELFRLEGPFAMHLCRYEKKNSFRKIQSLDKIPNNFCRKTRRGRCRQSHVSDVICMRMLECAFVRNIQDSSDISFLETSVFSPLYRRRKPATAELFDIKVAYILNYVMALQTASFFIYNATECMI